MQQIQPQELKKVAFVGAQSVGKTTLTNIFREKFSEDSSVFVLEEGARLFFEQNPHITDRSFQTQQAIQDFVLAREKAVTGPQIKLIITDRSVIDPIVLAGIWDTRENAYKLQKNVTSWLSTYSLFIVLDPVGVPSIPDPYRKETPEERLIIHEAFQSFCESARLPYLVVSGSLAQRVEKVTKIFTTTL